MKYRNFAPTAAAAKGLEEEVTKLLKEGVADNETEALSIAAQTMRGAGDKKGGTVEGVATCFDIGGGKIACVTGDDNAESREDEFASSMKDRQKAADKEDDDAARWLLENDPSLRK